MNEFLIRSVGEKNRAHIWLGADTACRMWSTGGLKQSRFEVRETAEGRDICQMCTNASLRQKVDA
jgi:hypothetical protein